jgi:hypothetical protein
MINTGVDESLVTWPATFKGARSNFEAISAWFDQHLRGLKPEE